MCTCNWIPIVCLSADADGIWAFIAGEGGTGKSEVIHTVFSILAELCLRHCARATAPTGTASIAIEGRTNASFFFDYQDPLSADNLAQLQKDCESLKLLFLEKASMLGLEPLGLIESRLVTVKGSIGGARRLFGGVRVVIVGDLNQLPAVRKTPLYVTSLKSPDVIDESRPGGTRARVYLESGFDLWNNRLHHCVILKENMRAMDDPVLSALLKRLHAGAMTPADIAWLESFVLDDSFLQNLTTRQAELFSAAPVVMQENVVRMAVSLQFALKHAQELGAVVYVCVARIGRSGRDFTSAEISRILVESETNHQGFPGIGIYFVGMRTMITHNLCTALAVANGQEGDVEKIFPNEADLDTPVVDTTLLGISVKAKFCNEPLAALHIRAQVPASIATHLPAEYKTHQAGPAVSTASSGSGPAQKQRRQPVTVTLPIFYKETTYPFKQKAYSDGYIRLSRGSLSAVPRYSMTHYKSQGRSFPAAILDLHPATRTNTYKIWVAWYVMLSRLQHYEGLCILRTFLPPAARRNLLSFLKELRPPPALIATTKRLEKMTQATLAKFDS
uniref:ATP-dependent DNA helicase n=1 Tax=Chromera velia CCMP2878 TaxID=1169474 RepID=A0A0K6SB67_9ALVE|eukprot:Cvel_13367.t2-p1 / transcript=Cvel_13367.t2 / gene=Cvel_13367 / organism=Chromera_velia_CCMP2878 / gene_product=hypothetical protein / transcript_product=hypothetical protein / location=Cvel_scaffold909:28826-30712(+) / protein_length=560 / sequence_SO=supercontig / SO=protein_coding / is_pseudo=false